MQWAARNLFLSQFSILKISELKAINNNISFYRLILILSGDIGLNPGPVYNHHPLNLKEWDIFKIKGFHLLYLNVNSLLPKIDELSNAAVIGIAEYKLDNYFLSDWKSNTLVVATVFNDFKNYLQLYTMFGLTQIIKSPTRITCSSTSLLIDQILVSLPERIPRNV